MGQHVEQLKNLEQLDEEVRELLGSGQLQARSYEGVVGVAIKLGKLICEQHEKLLDELRPPSPYEDISQISVELSEEEKLAALRAIRDHRREPNEGIDNEK